MPRVTSADVARASGVSRTTVSYVLNGLGPSDGVSVSRETRARVQAVAAELGYAPSAAARTLRRGRSDLVVCVLPDWPVGPTVETMLDHLTDALAARGLFVLVHHHRDSRPLAELWRAVTPRAAVGLAPFAEQDVRAMQQAGIQVVGAGEESRQAFDAGQQHLGRLQAAHLADAGHRRLAYATSDDARLAGFVAQRLAGVRAWCAEHGLPAPVAGPVAADVPAAEAVGGWRRAGVTGVAAYNDDVALAVLAGAHARGVVVPQELAVLGVDDVPASRLSTPPLTTVAQPAAAQSEHLARVVLAELDGVEAPGWPDDPVRIVARGTV
ncbi:LacI family DNA-binding transcriptional regulator [Cellulomonas sp. PhB143]|uniref:LacI family DNA-binding transcriptional regulator n=1 Tax=Cellulomonas sp. PhB143 TaxID=2485186 RepID=UPI000F485B1A|nr:LacI family DNA-binding transcriptional regulator [Cellulomonas sp. PhB143]ROS75348.1 LacI family transcriptional regulator [Cellulomonas sp. PhB143]